MRKKSILALLVAVVMVLSAIPINTVHAAQVQAFGSTVAAARSFTLAVDEDGVLWSFGDNQFGQLGDGTNVMRTSPVSVLEDVVHVAAGANHSLAITADGALWAWGDNRAGQVGTGTIGGTVLTPTAILSNIVYAGAYGNFSFAISRDNSLWYWGQNIFEGAAGHFRLGVVGEDNVRLPRIIMENVDFVTTNGRVMAVIRTDNTLMMWGSNAYGMIGDGNVTVPEHTIITYEQPGNPTGNPTGGGNPDTYDYEDEPDPDYGVDPEDEPDPDYGVDPEGELDPDYGVDPDPEPDPDYTLPPQPPVPVEVVVPAVNNDRHAPVHVLANAAHVVLGDNHVLAVTNPGELFVWGSNAYGQLGANIPSAHENIVPQPTPVSTAIRTIAAGANHSLAVNTAGALFVWGQNDRGQLGNGGVNVTAITQNTHISGIAEVWARENQSAVISSNALYLWGANEYGSIGDGTTGDRLTPARIMNNAVFVWLAGTHSFAIDDGGSLWAWGSNSFGQLGRGSTAASNTPVEVLSNVAVPGEALTFTPAGDEVETAVPLPDIIVGDALHPHFYAIDYGLLAGIDSDLTAISAIRSVVQGMNTGQRLHRNNADAVVRFAEHAVMNALSYQYESSRISVNSAFLSRHEAAVRNLAQMALNDIRNNGLEPDRRVENILRVTLPAGAAEITVDPSIQQSGIDRVVVNVGHIDIIIDGRQIHDTFTVTVPQEAITAAAANAALGASASHAGIRIVFTGNIVNNSRVRVGIPAITGTADRFQSVLTAEGTNIGGMVNPNTGRLETVLFSTATLTATYVRQTFEDIHMLAEEEQSAILYLRNKGRVGGRTDTLFDPLSPINRAEFATMLLMALTEYDMNFGTGGFVDVEGQWFAPFAGMARHRGYISGFPHERGDGTTYYTFEPLVNIPRVQLIAISGRVLLQSRDYFEPDGGAFMQRYLDFAEIPAWAHGHIAVMGNAQLYGDTAHQFFGPNNEMNRAEAATIIFNLYRRLY